MSRVLLLVAMVLAMASCIPAEPDDDLIRSFDPEDTVMGTIQERDLLRVGFDDEMPPALRGFVSNLGREVSDALGVQIEYSVGTTDELLARITDDSLDLVFPLIPITESRVDEMRKTHGFTDPYLVAHQKLLVGTGYTTAQSPEDLAGETVCAALDDQTGLDLALLVEDLTIEEDDVRGCTESFEAREVAAITAPDIVLAGVDAAGGAIVGDQLNTEGYGAVVEAGANAWTDYVSQVLEEAQQEGRWDEFFSVSFGELLGSQDPPGMSAEEAAALFPSGVDL
jgi:glutamate transport system substrate-binding protein